MSKFVAKDMSGTLFVNDKKATAKQPDFTGNVTVNGVKYRLSAWKKAGKQPFLSLALSEFKETKPEAKEVDNPFGI